MPKSNLSAADLKRAMSRMRRPGGKIPAFLRAHHAAPGRAMTMGRLASKVKYQDWRPMNLQYGLLAARIGEQAGRQGIWLGDLVEIVPPKGRSEENLTNSEYILLMRSHFANALEEHGWLD